MNYSLHLRKISNLVWLSDFDSQILKESADFIDSFNKEISSCQDQIRFLLHSYNLWSEDDTFTFPDGLTIYRRSLSE